MQRKKRGEREIGRKGAGRREEAMSNQGPKFTRPKGPTGLSNARQDILVKVSFRCG